MLEDTIKLPLNCTAQYCRDFLSEEETNQLYRQILRDYGIDQLKTEIVVNGKVNWSDYGKIMFVDEDLYTANKLPEELWGKTAIWSGELRSIKERVEAFTDKVFNVCVCIYYPNGDSGVGYHSDLIAFGDTSVIPSLSLGEERIFYLREKETLRVFEMVLERGSLLLMGENCQERYEHSLPTNPIYKNGRINLTFRQYGFNS